MAAKEEEPPSPSSGRYRVGYALAPKKVQSFIKPSLLNFAHQRGLDLVPIQPPLVQQQQEGPFHCIIHKLSGPDWNQQLQDFSSKYPTVPIIDPPQAIDRLHNRISMLQVVNHLNFSQSHSHYYYGIPNQVKVQDSQLLQDPTSLLQSLKFPLIAKPLVADGSSDSHHMSLVFNPQGLHDLVPPIVLQEFVNHGGVVFKVYVAGDYVQCVKRRSLPDISQDKLAASSQNSMPFSQISNLAAKDYNPDDDKLVEAAMMPPVSLLTQLAGALRDALGLHIFNFDVIRDTGGVGNRYLVIDINYFPGYAKMPSYETVFTDFLLDIILHRRQGEMKFVGVMDAAETD